MKKLVESLVKSIIREVNKDYTIYFDLDDTLSNYTKNLRTSIYTDPETGEKRPFASKDTANDFDFWVRAELLPGAKEMIKFAQQNFNTVKILSAVPTLSKAKQEETGETYYKAPIEGKTKWLANNDFSLPAIWTSSGTAKRVYATPMTVLVDDKEENIKAFEKAGGKGILFTNAQDVIQKLKDILNPEINIHTQETPISEIVPEPKINDIDDYAELTFEQIEGDSIVCDNCGWTWKIKDGGNDLFICHKCGHDNTPKKENTNFFEPLQNQDIDIKISSEPTRVDYYKDHIKNVVPSDFKVEKQKDKIVVSNISKPGLEHNPEFKDKLVSLTMFMIDNGLNIEPLPNLIFIEDDKQNASNILGRTAHYDPDNKCITLYTYNRHPKDILRSYAHEMIHHIQNLEGRISNITTQNINEDEYLKELELEAYSKGNMCFRGWENSLKND